MKKYVKKVQQAIGKVPELAWFGLGLILGSIITAVAL